HRISSLIELNHQSRCLFKLSLLETLRQDGTHQTKSLQGLPQIVAGRYEKPRLAEFGAFGSPFGTSRFCLFMFALGNIVNCDDDFGGRTSFFDNLRRSQQQHPGAKSGDNNLDLVAFNEGISCLDQRDERGKRWSIQEAVARQGKV